MSLSPPQQKQLHDALTFAFDEEGLRRLLSFGLGVDLDAIVAPGPREQRVFDLILWAEREDRIEELVKCAHEERQTNTELALLYSQLLDARIVHTGSELAPRQWVLVAGTGRLGDFTPGLAELCTYLGNGLAQGGFRLVTGGWPGVDETVARAFATTLESQGAALEDRLIQVLTSDTPAFPGGRLVFAARGEDYSRPVGLAEVVLMVGGLGGTMKTGELALRQRKYVFPLADTGGDAKKLYIQMLKSWDSHKWMKISATEFQRLARPQRSGIDAALALMLDIAQRTQ